MVTEAFSEPGAVDRVVSHPRGETPASFLLWMRLSEWAVHGWDLARALGTDDSLASGLAASIYSQLAPLGAGLASSGYFAPAIEVPDQAPVQAKLLALLGRRP